MKYKDSDALLYGDTHRRTVWGIHNPVSISRGTLLCMNEQDLLKDIYRLTKENNKMLKAIRRDALIGHIVSIIFWFVVIVLPIWYFYTAILPQLQAFFESAKLIQEGASGGFQNTEAFRIFLENLGALQASNGE
jgi:hypothetical protein